MPAPMLTGRNKAIVNVERSVTDVRDIAVKAQLAVTGLQSNINTVLQQASEYNNRLDRLELTLDLQSHGRGTPLCLEADGRGMTPPPPQGQPPAESPRKQKTKRSITPTALTPIAPGSGAALALGPKMRIMESQLQNTMLDKALKPVQELEEHVKDELEKRDRQSSQVARRVADLDCRLAQLSGGMKRGGGQR